MILPCIYIKEYCSILVPRTGSLKNTSTGHSKMEKLYLTYIELTIGH